MEGLKMVVKIENKKKPSKVDSPHPFCAKNHPRKYQKRKLRIYTFYPDKIHGRFGISDTCQWCQALTMQALRGAKRNKK